MTTTSETRFVMNILNIWINGKEMDCVAEEKFLWVFLLWVSIGIYCNILNANR